MGIRVPRIVVTAGVVLLGMVASAHMAAETLASSNPVAALSIVSDNRRALHASGVALIEERKSAQVARTLKEQSLRALSVSLVSPSHVRNLALAEEMAGKPVESVRKLMLASQSVSRRDLATQFWLAGSELRSPEPQLARLISHIDRGLRVERQSHELLFPILAQAITDKQTSSQIAVLARQKTPWYPGFIDFALSNVPVAPYLLALIMRSGGMPDDTARERREKVLLSRLFNEGHPDLARNYVAGLRGFKAEEFASIRLTPDSIDPQFSPFTWRLNETIADVEETQRGELELTTVLQRGKMEVAAEKLIWTNASRVVIGATFRFSEANPRESAQWDIACPKKGTLPTALRGTPVTANAANQNYELQTVLAVPCSPFMLQLRVSGDLGSSENSVSVSALTLRQ